MAPPPKPPGQRRRRRRRNKPPALEELPAEGYQGAVPPLGGGYQFEPEPDDEADEPSTVIVRYRAETRERYQAWAKSPMATKFTATDWNRLRWVIAPLFDTYMRGPSRDLAAELRLQEERLGATIMDRHRMRHDIGPGGPGAKRGNQAVRERQPAAPSCGRSSTYLPALAAPGLCVSNLRRAAARPLSIRWQQATLRRSGSRSQRPRYPASTLH